MTSADSCGVRIRFGIFGCGVVRKAQRDVAVMPDVAAIAWKSGSMTNLLGETWSIVTAWHGLQTSRANARPAWGSPDPSCAFAVKAVVARAVASAPLRITCSVGVLNSRQKRGIKPDPVRGDERSKS